MFPDGSSFGVIPFKGSSPAQDFAGFMDPITMSSVMIAELPVEAAPTLFESMADPAALAQRGISATSVERVEIAGLEALRISGTQSAQGLENFPKCILVIQGTSVTAMISAQMPLSSGQDACDLIQGVSQRPAQTLEEQIAGLPFQVDSIGTLQIQGTVGGSGMMLSKDGGDQASKPLMVIAHSIGGDAGPVPNAAQRMAISLQMLPGLEQYRDITVETSQQITIDGAPATEIIAVGLDKTAARKVRFVHWVRFATDGRIRLFGEASRDVFAQHYPDFVAVRDGLKAR